MGYQYTSEAQDENNTAREGDLHKKYNRAASKRFGKSEMEEIDRYVNGERRR